MQRRRNKRPELMYLIILTLVVGLPAMGQTVQVGQLAHIVDQTAVELAGLGWDEWSTAAEQLGEQQQLHDQLARLINTALVTVDLDQLIGDIEQLAEELGEMGRVEWCSGGVPGVPGLPARPDLNSGSNNQGVGNRGDNNTGDFNQGDNNTGNNNNGDNNTGDFNRGDNNTGNNNNGNNNQGNNNTGDNNNGNNNTGNNNQGNNNNGDNNTGDNHEGDGHVGEDDCNKDGEDDEEEDDKQTNKDDEDESDDIMAETEDPTLWLTQPFVDSILSRLDDFLSMNANLTLPIEPQQFR